MAYSIKRGIKDDGMDNTQRGLLVGLPAIALALSFGAAHHTAKTPSTHKTTTIPVVASLNGGGSGSGSSGSNNSGSSALGPGTKAPGSSGSVQSWSSTGNGASGGTSATNTGPSSGGSGDTGGGSGVVGGRGGGPTGGGTALPDCSLGQLATVNCRVPACTPALDLSPGQKAILSLDGTCLVLN